LVTIWNNSIKPPWIGKVSNKILSSSWSAVRILVLDIHIKITKKKKKIWSWYWGF